MFKTNEIFNGSIPPVCLAQILRSIDFSTWPEAYVGCSGMFSFESAIGRANPAIRLHGNDVSILSGALAGLVRGEPLPFTFKGKLAGYEERLAGKGYADRVGALILGLFLGRMFNGPSRYAERHWAYYENRFDDYVALCRAKAAALVAGVRLDSYYAGDFRDHLDKAMETGAGIVVSAPFIEGWYESWYRFINENVEWTPPTYRMWDPDDFPELIDKIDASGVPYVAAYKDRIENGKLLAYHRLGMKPPFYVYGRAGKASTVDRNSTERGTPFAFKAVDIGRLGPGTKVEIARVKAGYADYIKSLYLQETIAWTSAPLNFLIYLDDMLAGILSFSPPKSNIGPYKKGEYVYLLSDTATTRFGRISKLIAMLATSELVLHTAQKRLTHRPVQAVVTTVRSNNPVSMKYRGIYEVIGRKEPGPEERSGSKFIVNYASAPRTADVQAIYAEWWKRHFKDDRTRKVTTSYAKSAPDAAA
ncbi:hypothetical protein [uncultured Alsobacter sp.]|uniref:putative antirestriction adenine methyltransferase n=1 Tax=uncultured Alsobacter sp. TaxID=1748258 RepID=UPI0025CD59CF|nr:hypothetical protein [uncultured Alsobacter sp.]